MTKPIFIIKIPYTLDASAVSEMREFLNKDPKMDLLKEEYHILMFSDNIDKFEFEVLNSDKADEVTMEKVKEIELLITKNIK